MRKTIHSAKLFFALILCLSSIAVTNAQSGNFPGIDPNAVIIDDFENGSVSNWVARPGARGEKMRIELASAALGDPVRFGNYAMKIHVDFTDAQPNQTLMVQASPVNRAIAGNEQGGKRVGMWVYATPEVQGIWLRMATIAPGATGRHHAIDLHPAIDWLGWRYVQADIPAGHEFHSDGIRLLVTGNFPNYHVNGFVVIDNIRVTNRDFEEDLTPPTITNLIINGTPISDGQFFRSETNRISIAADFEDSGNNSSGINFETAQIIINGTPFKAGDTGFRDNREGLVITGGIGSGIDLSIPDVLLSNLHLANGTHIIEIQVKDNFGNLATRREMIVVYNPRRQTPMLSIETDYDLQVGNPFEIKINTDNPRDVRQLDFSIHLNNIGSVSEIGGVEFAPSVRNGTYSFNPRTGILTVSLRNNSRGRAPRAQRLTEEEMEDITRTTPQTTLATIRVNISENSNPTDILRVSPVRARATFRNRTSSPIRLFDAFERKVSPAFDFTMLSRVVGAPGEVLVTDQNGNPVSGATVRAMSADMSELISSAVTNERGIASGMNFTNIEQSVNIFAEKDGKFSFTRLIRTLRPLLTSEPTNIMSGANPDPTTMKTITWMQNPVTAEAPAMLRFAKKSEGEAHFQYVQGDTKMLEFTAAVHSGVAQGNRVRLRNLQPGTTYIYQVGDGANWSATREFTTTFVTDRFAFSAFGDLQASQWAHMDRWLAAAQTIENEIKQGVNHFFQLNVGDIVDTDDRWDYLEYYAHLYNERPIFASLDRIFTFANHEYMGTPNACNVKFWSGIPEFFLPEHLNARYVGDGTYYSIFGNMIVVSLDWEGAADGTGLEAVLRIVREQAKWMDYVFSKYPDKTWRIVSVHYPVFPFSTTPGTQEIYGPVFDRHNVNVVFCGHGHTFERVQVRNGVQTSPANDRRHFAPTPTPEGGTLHFQLGGMKETNQHGRWVHAQVDGHRMTFTIRDHNNEIVPEEGFVLYAR